MTTFYTYPELAPNMAVNLRQAFAVASFRAVSGCRKASPGILSVLLCRKSGLRQVKAKWATGVRVPIDILLLFSYTYSVS